MAIGTTFFIVGVLIVAIWLIIELKRMRHKIFAFFLIALILFTYFSFNLVLKKNNVDLGSVSGLVEAGKLYLSWLGSAFGNAKTITANAVKLDWSNSKNVTGG